MTKSEYDILQERFSTKPKVITRDDDFKIGAYMFPDRKRPCLCAQHGNEVKIYGTFHSIEAADLFMSELAKLIGAVDEKH